MTVPCVESRSSHTGFGSGLGRETGPRVSFGCVKPSFQICCWSFTCSVILILQKSQKIFFHISWTSLLSSSKIKTTKTFDKLSATAEGHSQALKTKHITHCTASAGFHSRMCNSAVCLVSDITQNYFLFPFPYYEDHLTKDTLCC